MQRFSAIKFVRNAAVIALAFWLAGAGCLLGCEGIATAAPAEHHDSASSPTQVSILAVEGDACASGEGHSCCKKKARPTKKQSTADAYQRGTQAEVNPSSSKLNESSTGGMQACPFAMARALAVAKVGDGHTSASAGATYALPTDSFREQKLALSTTSPLPNRGHTYLHCCSFLI